MAIALQPDQEMAAHWKTQIEQSEKELHRWHKRGEKISKAYRDERDDNDKGVARRLNLFWANTETLKPAIYSKVPVPICERRFLDKDIVGRVASTILERTLRYEVQTSFDNAVRRARNDYLLSGRGQVWIRYYPQFGEAVSPEQTADNDITGPDGKPVDEPEQEAVEEAEAPLVSETVCVDYVHWQDYGTLPALARTEDEVEGKYRRLYMSRTDCIEHFGEEIGKEIKLDHAPADGRPQTTQTSPSTVTGNEGMQATIYEIWWKPERKVYFIAKSYDKVCKEVDDPLKLDGFFPCPAPLTATMTNDTTIPVPDYAESQDQYVQIDDLTKRIDVLTAACKVVGAYNSATESLKRIFEEATEPNLIPVDSWAMFAEKGGLKGNIELVDIKQIAEVIKILIDVRANVMADLDRTTGISDIMRGTSDARETMGAQRLKTNNSATRLQERQDEMARFCRDIICIMGEIVSEQYSPETLIQISGAMHDEGLDPPALPSPMMGHNGGPPLAPVAEPSPGVMPPQAQPNGPPTPPAGPQLEETPEQKSARKMALIMEAIALLRQDKLRGFRIDIETDSTVQGDAQQEKEQRVEFLKGVTDFIEKSAIVVQQVPEFAPLAAKMLGFGVRGFRVGRDLEAAIEDFCEKAEQAAKAQMANPNQTPSPEQIKADSERYKADSEIKRQQLENEGEHQNNMVDLESKKLDVRMKEMELEMKKLEFHGRMAEASAPKEGDGESSPSVPQHHLMSLDKIAKSAEMFDIASRRNAAPKKLVRGPDGKVSHVITDFQEQ